MCLYETYSKFCIGKHLFDSFPIQNGPKQGDTSSPLLFNFLLEYAIKKVQENQVAYADDMNLLGDNLNTVMKEEKQKLKWTVQSRILEGVGKSPHSSNLSEL
jgi:hypothetical protein